MLRGGQVWPAPTPCCVPAGGPPSASRGHTRRPAGNHDGEADLARHEIVALDAATGGGLSLTQPGPASLGGTGNYWLDVLAPGSSNETALRLWFLDSGNRGCNGSAAGW